ncbi:hypothetical protein MBOU_31920 [Mycobacterium bourgelatii]|uniref:Uncharacterized protein n=1 Tax=Mycobacterium bourgelatii TaxID=1273442 RepID=A0A7I9YR32_MYCBU|nr:hypothetical protein MBOU_31920 [Mycobacterium bourgelatii]
MLEVSNRINLLTISATSSLGEALDAVAAWFTSVTITFPTTLGPPRAPVALLATHGGAPIRLARLGVRQPIR